jgi:hypothetical protein
MSDEEKDRIQMVMLTIMSQAFSDFSDKVGDILQEQSIEEFEKDPHGTALKILDTAFTDFKAQYIAFQKEQFSAPKITEVKVVTDLEAFIDTEYGEYFKKKGEPDGFH